MICEERKSNFELLKVISIIFIIIHHFYIHGIVNNNMLALSPNIILTCFLGSFGKCSSLIFIMISGYFMIDKKFNVSRILKIILQFFIYNLIILVFVLLLKESISISDIIKLLFPILFGNWFIITYLELQFLSPILNKVIKSLTREQNLYTIILCVVFFSIIPSIIPNSNWNWCNICLFIIAYFIGAYIKVFNVQKSKKLYIYISISLLLIFSVNIVNIYLNNGIINLGIDITSLNSPIVVLLAFSIIMIFKEINIKSKTINYLATSTLGIYILHDNYLIRNLIWNKIYPNSLIINNPYYWGIYIIKITVIFIGFLIIDKILMLLFNKPINYIANKLTNILKFNLKEIVK